MRVDAAKAGAQSGTARTAGTNVTMNSIDYLQPFLKRSVPGYLSIEPIAGDASVRAYYRVFCGDGTRMLCVDPNLNPDSDGDYPFFILAKLLNDNGIPVPEIHARDASLGVILMQDLGDRLLEDAVPSLGTDAVLATYMKIIDIMARLQTIPPRKDLAPFRLSFDAEKLMFEFDFFLRHALSRKAVTRGGGDGIGELRSVFACVVRELDRPELFVLNHRDFHSRNVMLSGGGPVLIDFQDARMGLPQYDAASFIMDPYTVLEEPVRERLKEYHFRSLEARGYRKIGYPEYLRMFDMTAFQRHVKALGTYFYQMHERGSRRYVKSISAAFHHLDAYCGGYPKLARALDIMKSFLPEYQTES